MNINISTIKRLILISVAGLLLGFLMAFTADVYRYRVETIQYNQTATSAAGEFRFQLTEMAKTPVEY